MTLAPLVRFAAARCGLVPGHQFHVLRNHSVGNKSRVAASGPRFAIVMRMKHSSGDDFAYSTKTSK